MDAGKSNITAESLDDQGLVLTSNLVKEINAVGRQLQEAARSGRLPKASISEPYVKAFAELERRLQALEAKL